MKKRIGLIIAMLAFTIGLFAQNCVLFLTNGQHFSCKLIETTDTTVTVIRDETDPPIPIAIPANKIKKGQLSHNGMIEIVDGKVVVLKNRKEVKTSQQRYDLNNPNYAIGKALKNTGATAIGIGVPCFVTGLITCIVGTTMTKNTYSNIDYITTKDMNKINEQTEENKSKGETASRLQLAGCWLGGAGVALTIIGIPIYASGKQIMKLNVNITGNGAGLALNF